MNKDVFISYKSDEAEEAVWLKGVLESNGISCWMAPDSIPGGSSYAAEIGEAIENCKVFVLVLSGKAQSSIWVSKELDCALNAAKPVLPFMIEDFELNKEFNYYLTNVQRYDAYANKAKAMEKMLSRIRAIIGTGEAAEPVIPAADAPKQKEAKPKSKMWSTATHIFSILAIVFLVIMLPPVGLILAVLYGIRLYLSYKKEKNNKK